jgi:tRNA(fMet)-specific endonuclease VapC
MIRLCLDTSAYSRFKAGDPDAIEALKTAQWIGVTSIVLGELRSGFLIGRLAERNERELVQFLADPVVSILDVDDAATRHYAAIILALRKKGKPIPTNDIWIASVAARENATVLTYDGHFSEIERVNSRILGQDHRT